MVYQYILGFDVSITAAIKSIAQTYQDVESSSHLDLTGILLKYLIEVFPNIIDYHRNSIKNRISCMQIASNCF